VKSHENHVKITISPGATWYLSLKGAQLSVRFRRIFYVPGNHDLWARPIQWEIPGFVVKMATIYGVDHPNGYDLWG